MQIIRYLGCIYNVFTVPGLSNGKSFVVVPVLVVAALVAVANVVVPLVCVAAASDAFVVVVVFGILNGSDEAVNKQCSQSVIKQRLR